MARIFKEFYTAEELERSIRSWRLHAILGVHQVTQHSHSIAINTKLQTSRYIIVGFQKDRAGKTIKKMSEFNNCKLKNSMPI